jgi:excisionase family DNA binding protein
MHTHGTEPAAATEPMAYGVDEAARASAIGRTSIYEAIRSGQLRARKCGRRTVILAPDLGAFLASLPEKASREGEVMS